MTSHEEDENQLARGGEEEKEKSQRENLIFSESDQFVFELATYLLASARGCIDEPKLYGPLRLIDAISRLVMIHEKAECIHRDDFLLAAKERIDKKGLLVMVSEDEFTQFLDGLITDFATELKRRSNIQ